MIARCNVGAARSTPIWLLPNLFSLDAPIVAVVWQAFIASCYPSTLRTSGRLVLALTVWSIYLADRILDARRPAAAVESARHKFYRNHWYAGLILLAGVTVADLWVTVVWLRPAVFHAGIVLSAGVLAYLVILHFARIRIGVPKEIAVAVLFAAGTFLVAWTSAPRNTPALLVAAASFAMLCLANLVAIETWEWRELRQAVSDPPHRAIIWLGRRYLVWVPAMALLAAITGSRWYIAISLSAAALAFVFAVGSRISIDVRRVLVDAVLLFPLLLMR